MCARTLQLKSFASAGSYSNVDVQLANQRYQPQHWDLPYSGYPLNWGYNREYSLVRPHFA